MEDVELKHVDRDDIICPICLNPPHNSVLLICSSYHQGCRPFVCDTDHLHSNCFDRLKNSYVLPSTTCNLDFPNCPLCRGDVTGCVVVDKARSHSNSKTRCCEEELCYFKGNYPQLQEHVRIVHPFRQPSKIDPGKQRDWDDFQQSVDVIDVLSTIRAEVPQGVVLGDYVIEYGDDESGEEYEDFPGDEGNWWTSCILYQVFDNFRTSRSRRRGGGGDSGREMGLASHENSGYDGSISAEGSGISTVLDDGAINGVHDEISNTSIRSASRREIGSSRSSRRLRSRFYDI